MTTAKTILLVDDDTELREALAKTDRMAVVKVARTFSVDDGRTKSFAAGDRVTCWSCHHGPMR